MAHDNSITFEPGGAPNSFIVADEAANEAAFSEHASYYHPERKWRNRMVGVVLAGLAITGLGLVIDGSNKAADQNMDRLDRSEEACAADIPADILEQERKVRQEQCDTLGVPSGK